MLSRAKDLTIFRTRPENGAVRPRSRRSLEGIASEWQIDPRRATVRTNFHIATGLRIIHFAGGAR